MAGLVLFALRPSCRAPLQQPKGLSSTALSRLPKAAGAGGCWDERTAEGRPVPWPPPRAEEGRWVGRTAARRNSYSGPLLRGATRTKLSGQVVPDAGEPDPGPGFHIVLPTMPIAWNQKALQGGPREHPPCTCRVLKN